MQDTPSQFVTPTTMCTNTSDRIYLKNKAHKTFQQHDFSSYITFSLFMVDLLEYLHIIKYKITHTGLIALFAQPLWL